MNFQQLEYVIAVYEQQHFGKAALASNITQATLSAMIIKLEDELGYQLFDRSRKPILPTEKGILFIKKAKEILIEKNSLYQIQNDNIKELKGKLTIGIIPTVAISILPRIIPGLIKNNPELELTILEITTDQIIDRLKNQSIDLGILATPIEGNDLEYFPIYKEKMLVYGDIDKSKEYINSRDIKRKKVWLLEEGHCFRDQSIQVCQLKEKDLSNDRLHFEGGSFESLINLTDTFGGLTIIPDLYYQSLSETKKRKCCSFKSPAPVREISIMSYRPKVQTSTISFLNEYIKSIIEPLVDLDPENNQTIGLKR